MQFFVFFSWLSCVSIASILIVIFILKRYWFFRPSLQIVVWFNIMIQWGGALSSKYIYNFLPSPWHFLWVTFLIPFFLILYNFAARELWVKSIWDKILEPLPSHEKGLSRLLWVFLSIIIVVNIYFFFKVPFKSTGLYNLFADPLAANISREESLKLVPDLFVRYGYNIVRNALAPILAVIIVMLYLEKRKNNSKRALYTILSIIGLLYILFVVSLPGARSGPAGVILCIIVAVYILKGMPAKPRYIIIGILAVLSVPIIITLLREGQNITARSFLQYLSYMFGRVFISPMNVGLWHMHYAQINGFVGIDGVRPLALLLGGEYINLPNIVGLTYMSNPLKTVNADAGFFFDYYACFGLYTVVISTILTIVLDLILIILRRCDILMIPLLALMFFKSMNFVESAYTPTFFTHGFILIPLLAIITNISIKKTGLAKEKHEFSISVKI
jgi:hypothetical protein